MQDLAKQEQFELEVLDKLNSHRLLNALVFGGGTMLRLCYGLDRFSVDLDFWVIKKIDLEKLFLEIKKCLAQDYLVKDATNKFYTLIFEIKSKRYPRSLKIEIRKETKKVKTDLVIAFSKFSDMQVLLRAVSLDDMLQAKIEAFLSRKEIRDVFDLEFLVKKGYSLRASQDSLNQLLKGISSLTEQDYTQKLGSLLEESQRDYYTKERFKILTLALKEILSKK